jgi:hypothetical protein
LPTVGIDDAYFAGCSLKSIINPSRNWIFIKNSLFIERFDEERSRSRKTPHVFIGGVTVKRKDAISGEQYEFLESRQGRDPWCEAADSKENQWNEGRDVRTATQLRDLTLKVPPEMNSTGKLTEAVDPANRLDAKTLDMKFRNRWPQFRPFEFRLWSHPHNPHHH